MNNYGLDIWGDNDFVIQDGRVKVNHKSQPSLIEIVEKLRQESHTGPLLLRFPHLIKKQIDLIYHHFRRAIKELDYQGKFKAVFPLKVNSYPNFLKEVVKYGKKYNYGLEAGSKAELILAIAHSSKSAPITVNGFKDNEMISLCFLASELGHNITVIIEGINELESIIKIAKSSSFVPNIGVRVRLHSGGKGVWAKSGGINSKFGLNATEIIKTVKLLKQNSLLDKFSMLHFHIGSLLNEIAPLKKALREVGNIYAELKKMGADSLDSINIGGGLSVEYSQHKNRLDRNYTLKEYVNDVVFMLKEIAVSKSVLQPTIFIESGRFISASHAVLIAPVLELLSNEYDKSLLELKETNPPLIEEMYLLYKDMNSTYAREYLHDAIDHLESLLTLFDLGYIDLVDRSNTEILFNLIYKKATNLLDSINKKELETIKKMIQERYLLNFSLFQSLPDSWGIGQKFPIMPIDMLDKPANKSATLWDISCDSDGEIPFDKDFPLFLHSVDLKNQDYFLGFFLLGAYQDILGMKHNLFAKPTEVVINITSKGYKVKNIKNSDNIVDIFENLGYKTVKKLDKKLNKFLYDNNYLKTVSLQKD